MNRPTLAGMTARSACGSTMYRLSWMAFSPIALAASIWPRGIACSPPRTFSAT